MQVLRGLSNPATVSVATVTNTMSSDQGTWAEPSDLAAGTYWYAIKPISDTGEAGTADQLGSMTVEPPLAFPSGTQYKSGDASSGIVIGFALDKPAAELVAYVSPVNGVLTTASGYSGFSGFSGYSGASLWYSAQGSLPSEAFGGYPGLFHALPRAVSGAYESQNIAGLDLTIMPDGSYYDQLPNVAGLDPSTVIVSAGLTLHCRGAYQYQYEPFGKGYGMLLSARTQDGTHDWLNPIGQETLSVYDTAMAVADFMHTFPASGTYYLACRAVTALGTMGPVSDEVLVQVSDEALTATGTLVQARG
jgi:hypothetical protein